MPCRGEVLYSAVVLDHDEYFQVPYWERSADADNLLRDCLIDSVTVRLDYKDYHCGIHDCGAALGVAIWFIFKDADSNPAYESPSVLFIPWDAEADGYFEIDTTNCYLLDMLGNVDRWVLLSSFEVAVDEYDHPFPKNPGFDRVTVSVIISGTPHSTRNDHRTWSEIKAQYRR